MNAADLCATIATTAGACTYTPDAAGGDTYLWYAPDRDGTPDEVVIFTDLPGPESSIAGAPLDTHQVQVRLRGARGGSSRTLMARLETVRDALAGYTGTVGTIRVVGIWCTTGGSIGPDEKGRPEAIFRCRVQVVAPA